MNAPLPGRAVWPSSARDPILDFKRMTLAEILAGVDLVTLSPPGLPLDRIGVTSLCYDSRRSQPGAVFFALPGTRVDGNSFVGDAVARGAIAVVSEAPRPADLSGAVLWIQVLRARQAMAIAAMNFYRRPADALNIIGVTGTNGKTTTTFLLHAILQAAGYRPGLFGTVVYATPAGQVAAAHTTPESVDLAQLLAELREAGGTHAVMEVSSHALALDRVWACRFHAAVFTNLTRDHLDFHPTMEDYFAAKRKLFEANAAGRPAVGIVNADDPYGRRLVGLAERTLTYAIEESADVRATDFQTGRRGLRLRVASPAGPLELTSHLVGRVNVYNILAAVATAIGLGISAEAIREGVRRLESVPGRFERIDLGQPFVVAVDYAHTDDALRRLCETARELGLPGRLLLLFGAGGDRDRAKRPLMGRAAGQGADLVVVTSDNPRSEDPQAIIADILPGLQETATVYHVEPDRARAIEWILRQARPGDVVLLAGKGHETYQVVGQQILPFDDREVARTVLRKLGYGADHAEKPAVPGGS